MLEGPQGVMSLMAMKVEVADWVWKKRGWLAGQVWRLVVNGGYGGYEDVGMAMGVVG